MKSQKASVVSTASKLSLKDAQEQIEIVQVDFRKAIAEYKRRKREILDTIMCKCSHIKDAHIADDNECLQCSCEEFRLARSSDHT